MSDETDNPRPMTACDDSPVGAGRHRRPSSPLAEAMIAYAARLRAYYPLAPQRSSFDQVTMDAIQAAFVLERSARALEPDAFEIWLRNYARSLFSANAHRHDTYAVAMTGIAGDIEVALLAWSSKAPPDDSFAEVAARAFRVWAPGTPANPS